MGVIMPFDSPLLMLLTLTHSCSPSSVSFPFVLSASGMVVYLELDSTVLDVRMSYNLLTLLHRV